jgi:hypothetical protein
MLMHEEGGEEKMVSLAIFPAKTTPILLKVHEYIYTHTHTFFSIE